jgi:GntR family transcriptional regulator, transcriptional repressor for pyruvate dehydrogenase complex
MPLHPVKRTSVADDVFEQLLAGVLDGELAAGSALPAERALSEALGVNRQAVREALQRLAQAGVVDIRHGGGTQVRDYRRSAGLDLLPRLLVGPGGEVDADVARSLMELRRCLGADAARRCAERGGSDVAAQLTHLAEALPAITDAAELVEADLGFWDAVVDGSGNIAYRLAFNALRRTYEPIAALLHDVLDAELRAHDDRMAIARAVAEADGDAAERAARRLLARGEDAVTALLAQL